MTSWIWILKKKIHNWLTCLSKSKCIKFNKMKTQGANNLRVGIYCTVEELGALVDTWQQRTSKCEDLDFYLHKGGDNWISNNLLTNFKTGIEKSSIEERIRLYGSNKSKDIKPPCTYHDNPSVVQVILRRSPRPFIGSFANLRICVNCSEPCLRRGQINSVD